MSAMCTRDGFLGIALVATIAVAIKLLLAIDIPASALFSDDYNSLNRAIYYSQGYINASEGGYPFSEVSAGLVYFLTIAPWIFFDLNDRMFFVFTVNILFSGLTIFFAAASVYRVTRQNALSTAIIFASLPPVFIFSYYAMTENLVFFFTAAVVWLSADFVKTVKDWRLFVILLIIVALLPITRAPGFAVLPGLLLLTAANIKRIGWRRALLVAVLTPAVAAISYFLYSSAFDASREALYVRGIRETISTLAGFRFLFEIFAAQSEYLFIAAGTILLPAFLVFSLQLFGHRSAQTEQVRNVIMFCGTTALAFVGFSLVHLLHNEPGGWYIYGRYADPALLTLVIGALVSVMRLQKLTFFGHCFLLFAVPLVLYFTILHLEPTKWVPVNQSGLAFFSLFRGDLPTPIALAWIGACVVFAILPIRSKLQWNFLFVVLIAFNATTIYSGMSYTVHRARKIAFAVEGAKWLAAKTKHDAAIGYDWQVIRDPAPGALKRMGNVYTAMMFYTYPRAFHPVKDSADLSCCDYLFTLKETGNNFGLPLIWTNDSYALYHVK